MNEPNDNKVSVSFTVDATTDFAWDMLSAFSDNRILVVHTDRKWNDYSVLLRMGHVSIDDERDGWEAGLPIKCTLNYTIDLHHDKRGRWYSDKDGEVIYPEEAVRLGMLTPEEAKQLMITFYIHAAAAAKHDFLWSYPSPSQKIRTHSLNDFIEGKSGNVEEIDFPAVFGDFYEGTDSEKLVVDVPLAIDYSVQRAKLIEVIALCYAVKGVPKQVFIDRFKGMLGSRAEYYWRKVVGADDNPFFSTVLKQAQADIQKMYDKRNNAWRSHVNKVQDKIDRLQTRIDREREKFERTVIAPLLAQQRDLYEEAADKTKEAHTEELRAAVNAFRKKLDPEVQKRVSLRSVYHLSRQYVYIGNERYEF